MYVQTWNARYNIFLQSLESSGEYLDKNLAEKGLRTSYTYTIVCPPERGDNLQAFSMIYFVLKCEISGKCGLFKFKKCLGFFFCHLYLQRDNFYAQLKKNYSFAFASMDDTIIL